MDVEEVEVVVAHNERATLRVGDVFLKIDADQTRPTPVGWVFDHRDPDKPPSSLQLEPAPRAQPASRAARA